MFLRKLKNLSDIKHKANLFRIQSNNSMISQYFWIGFIDFMFAGKKMSDFTSLFSSMILKKVTYSVILSYFKDG